MTNPVPTPAECMPSRDRVREALRSLPRPVALDEAIVTDIAQDYVDGLLIEARAALASQPEGHSASGRTTAADLDHPHDDCTDSEADHFNEGYARGRADGAAYRDAKP